MIRNLEYGGVDAHMNGYMQTLFYCFVKNRKHQYKLVETPAGPNLFSIDPDSDVLSAVHAIFFNSTVAKLLYLCRRVRINVIIVILFLCTHVKNPTKQDQSKLDKVIIFLYALK